MNKMFEDVNTKIRKKNQILFNKDSKCLSELIAIIDSKSKKEMVYWSLKEVESLVTYFEDKYQDNRPRIAFNKINDWSTGNIKMREAKEQILLCHGIAKELTNRNDIAIIHAIGQALSTPHVKEHSLGLIFYELTSIVIDNKDYEEKVLKRINEYKQSLNIKKSDLEERKWAPFLEK